MDVLPILSRTLIRVYNDYGYCIEDGFLYYAPTMNPIRKIHSSYTLMKDMTVALYKTNGIIVFQQLETDTVIYTISCNTKIPFEDDGWL